MRHTRVLAIAGVLALLTSVEAAASSKVESDSIFMNREKSPPGPATARDPDSSTDSVSANGSASGTVANLYSESYWTAVADLDVAALTKAARNAPEAAFAQGMRFLASRDRAEAESTFAALTSTVSDFNVGIASQMML